MTQWGLDNLFNPGKRHMDDEKRRLQATREEVGDASGGRRIDLDSGAVSIAVRRPRHAAPEEPDEPDDPDASDGSHVADGSDAVAPPEVDVAPEVQSEPALALSGEADLEPSLAAPGGAPEADPRTDPAQIDPDAAEGGSTGDEDAQTPDQEVTGAPAVEPEPPAEDVLAAAAAAPATPPKRMSASAWARRG